MHKEWDMYVMFVQSISSDLMVIDVDYSLAFDSKGVVCVVEIFPMGNKLFVAH